MSYQLSRPEEIPAGLGASRDPQVLIARAHSQPWPRVLEAPASPLHWQDHLRSQLPEGSLLEAQVLSRVRLRLLTPGELAFVLVSSLQAKDGIIHHLLPSGHPHPRAPMTAPLGPTGLISSWLVQSSLHCPLGQSVHFGKTPLFSY